MLRKNLLPCKNKELNNTNLHNYFLFILNFCINCMQSTEKSQSKLLKRLVNLQNNKGEYYVGIWINSKKKIPTLVSLKECKKLKIPYSELLDFSDSIEILNKRADTETNLSQIVKADIEVELTAFEQSIKEIITAFKLKAIQHFSNEQFILPASCSEFLKKAIISSVPDQQLESNLRKLLTSMGNDSFQDNEKYNMILNEFWLNSTLKAQIKQNFAEIQTNFKFTLENILLSSQNYKNEFKDEFLSLIKLGEINLEASAETKGRNFTVTPNLPQKIAILSEKGKIIIVDCNGEPIREVSLTEANYGSESCIEFSQNGEYLAVALTNIARAYVLSVKTGEIINTIVLEEKDVRYLKWNEDKFWLSFASGNLQQFSIASQNAIRKDGFSLGRSIRSFAIMESTKLISGDQNGRITIYSLESKEVLKILDNYHKGSIESIDISEKYKLLASGSLDSTIKVLSLSTFEEVWTKILMEPVISLMWSSTNSLLYALDSSKTFYVLDVLTGDVVVEQVLNLYNEPLSLMIKSEISVFHIITAKGDFYQMKWDIRKGELIRHTEKSDLDDVKSEKSISTKSTKSKSFSSKKKVAKKNQE